MTAQFYLITSANTPEDLWIFSEDKGNGKDFNGKITEDFGQTLTPLGEDLTDVSVIAPEGSKFAGILWGDGEHFDEYRGNTWGILGTIERKSSTRGVIHCVDGEEIEFDETIPQVMPAEAFGLTGKPWWKTAYHWCNW